MEINRPVLLKTMIKQSLDLHIHSKYSRACSGRLDLPTIAEFCVKKGIDIVSTGDFTHPTWFKHIKENLVEDSSGIYKLRNHHSNLSPKLDAPRVRTPTSELRTQFIIGTEVASIKKHAGKTRRVHLLLFSPSLESTQKFNKKLEDRGVNIRADGRPIIGMNCRDILEMMLDIDERMVMVPAHAWTPWFGIFGSKGGYNTMGECFEDLEDKIFAIETGLSSNPLMNWRLSALDKIALISNSDAHSPQKLGREVNFFEFNNKDDINFAEIMRIFRERDRKKFLYTTEFYPEEGKYFMDGHRDCNFVCTPEETKKYSGLCRKCKKPMVLGVMNRIVELADRTVEQAKKIGVNRVPYKSLVPLPEIISNTIKKGVATKAVVDIYNRLITEIGSEFEILLHASLEDIEKVSTKYLATAVDRVRRGEIFVQPGYDGEFGVVNVFGNLE